MKKQEVFNELWACFVDKRVVPVEIQEAAHNHGIRVEAVEKAALALTEEDDFDESES